MEAEALAGRHILLLEDEMMILLMMEEMLIDLGGASVTSAATVGQALTKIDRQVFDAAVLDVNLNGTKSYPVAERLAARGIPFVFSTGYSDHAPGDAYADRPVLKKPFRYPELASALSRLLSKHLDHDRHFHHQRKEETMSQAASTSITRRTLVAGLTLAAGPVGVLAVDKAHAQTKQTAPEKSLYDRLGGVFAIAAVVDHFSDAVVKNPIVGQKSKNAQLREWHTKNLGRLPGLKFMRTLWVCNISGGPYQFTATKPGTTPLGLEEAHRDLRISPAEFDEVAAELGRTLDFVKVPTREKDEVLAAFAAHKGEVTAGYVAVHKGG